MSPKKSFKLHRNLKTQVSHNYLSYNYNHIFMRFLMIEIIFSIDAWLTIQNCKISPVYPSYDEKGRKVGFTKSTLKFMKS